MPPRRPAGIVSRGMAAVLDLIVVVVLLAGLYLAVTFVIFIVDVRTFTFPTMSWLFSTAGFLLASVIYLTVSWSAFGRTPGQLLLGLRVCRRKTGASPHLVRAFLRACVCTFFPIGLAWVVFSPSRRAVHDILTRTEVVYSGH